MSFKISIPENAQRLIRLLGEQGHTAYVVGGCVRDSLMGRVPHDWDICTSATPQQMLEIFNSQIAVLVEEYILTEDELNYVIDSIYSSSLLTESGLRDIFEAQDRNLFCSLLPLLSHHQRSRHRKICKHIHEVRQTHLPAIDLRL